MYTLETDYLSAHVHDFLCSYGDVDVKCILSDESFAPETFFVGQKRRGEELLFFREVDFTGWVGNMIADILDHVDVGEDRDEAAQMVFQNVLFLLDYEDNASQIANQEFVDMIRRVVAFTLTGDVCAEIHTAKSFNSLAAGFLPLVVNHFRTANLPARELLKYSIASGLSGLDLKGAPAAASAYANDGIEMKGYASLDAQTAAGRYIASLNALYSVTRTTLFDWDVFTRLLREKKRLVWMTDDYIESHFDLLLISRLLSEFEVTIDLIPKNGFHGNDLSYADLMALLSGDLFPELLPYLSSGRLTVSPFGAKMGAANIRRLSPECVSAIKEAGLLFAKGCRIHEMMQGGLSVHLFSSFNVVRKLSEITSGFLAEEHESVFVYLSPGEYSFWGVSYANASPRAVAGGTALFCASTSADHKRRQSMTRIADIRAEFSRLKAMEAAYVGDKRPLYGELDLLAQKMALHPAEQYGEAKPR